MQLKYIVTLVLLLTAHASASSRPCYTLATKQDAVRGLAVVPDPTCADRSGVGCITSYCRYCRATATSAHENLPRCSDIAGVLSPTPTPQVLSPTVDKCALGVSPGDLSAGVSAATDSSCANGGLGCFSSSCRFCSVFNTTLSVSFLACTAVSPSSFTPPQPAFDLTCSTAASSGDTAAGITVVTDLSCALGGVGCTNDVCRFCQVRPTELSQAYMRCDDVDTNDGSDIFFTPLPVTRPSNGVAIASTDRPALDQIVVVNGALVSRPLAPSAPLGSSTTVILDACAASVSSGDATVGVSATTDSSCQLGGLGCYSSSCRFCKVFDTPQSSSWLPCASISS